MYSSNFAFFDFFNSQLRECNIKLNTIYFSIEFANPVSHPQILGAFTFISAAILGIGTLQIQSILFSPFIHLNSLQISIFLNTGFSIFSFIINSRALVPCSCKTVSSKLNVFSIVSANTSADSCFTTYKCCKYSLGMPAISNLARVFPLPYTQII